MLSSCSVNEVVEELLCLAVMIWLVRDEDIDIVVVVVKSKLSQFCLIGTRQLRQGPINSVSFVVRPSVMHFSQNPFISSF